MEKPLKNKIKDFNWVEDEINEPIRFSNGDKIKVINIGDVEALIHFLGTYGKTYRTGKFGSNIEGEVVDVMNNEFLFGLREKKTKQLLFFPWLDKMDHYTELFPNLNVKYEFIDDDLNESSDLDWIKDIEPPNFDFNFDGKEHWVDVSNIDREGRKKIVNHIKKTVPNYEEFESDLFGSISRGNYKGIIIHCGSDRTYYEPEENLLCSAESSYEDDYKLNNPYSDMIKSVYHDGQQILDYITMDGDGDEELDESLEWSDKDVPFDEKDKSFESDPSWKDDEDWSLNPERSYWKQGDTGGSGGGDVNESNELEWISNTRPTLKDVFDENLIEVGDILTLYGTLEDEDGLREQQVDDFKVKIESVSHKGELSSTYFTPLQKKYWDFLGYDGTGDVRFVKKDGDLQLVGRINSKDVVEESNDLDWIKGIKPKGFEKSKSYVVDVSHLKPYTPISVSPTSEEYTKLTRADVLDKFKELGYNVDEVSIDDADYLYIEPNDKAGYWDDDVWVDQTHWLDYDMKHNTPDPTYDGKYEIIDINDLMFLLDNKFISESNEWSWVEDIPGTKEFGQKYRYFEIVACYNIDYESEECEDEYSHYVRIPKYEADEIWDHWVDYFAGIADGDGEGVIRYAIKNRLISHFEINEIIMFEGVRELDKNTYDRLTDYRDTKMDESNDFDWVKDIKPNWDTYYGGIIMKDIEGLPKNLEDVTSEMLLPIWMKIETINKGILTRKNRGGDVNKKLLESMDQIEWLFARIMALVDGETDSLVSSRMEPQEYYNSRKLSIINHIKGMTQQLELLGESNDFDWAKDIKPNRRDSKYYIIDERSSNTLKDGEWFIIEILDRDNHSVKWRSYAWNVEDVFSWRPGWEVKILSPQEFTQLLGLGTSPTYWYPHDGDLSDLPKNHDFGIITQMNESNEFKGLGWISKISSDDYEPNIGDHIEIVNQGKSHLFKNWLSPSIWMDYKMGRITNSNGNIEGVVQNDFPVQNNKDNFVVLIKGTKNEYIFLPKRFKIKQIKEKTRDPEWHGLDIIYKPIELRSELKEDSSKSTDWGWAKDIKPKFTKITSNIYQYGDGSLPRIKVVFKRVEDGEIKTNVIEFDDYEFIDSEEYMNRHFILMGVDDEDNDWLVDGIAYFIGGGEYEWDVNWESLENNG